MAVSMGPWYDRELKNPDWQWSEVRSESKVDMGLQQFLGEFSGFIGRFHCFFWSKEF
jgi:hypothetical protein